MTLALAPRPPLLQFALDGARVRQAASVLEREASHLVVALRRAIPFLARRPVAIEVSSVRAMPLADVIASLTAPVHITHLVASPGLAAGALIIDAGANALLIDGILGGDGKSLPELRAGGLSGPQHALVSGLAKGIVRSISTALSTSLGLSVEPHTSSPEAGHVETAPLVLLIDLGDDEHRGRLALLLPREALLARIDGPAEPNRCEADARVAAVLDDVELLLVVELGRVRLHLGDLAALRVGDTLRLDVSVSTPVVVRADGQELMRGRPTNSGGRIGVKIVQTSANRRDNGTNIEGVHAEDATP